MFKWIRDRIFISDGGDKLAEILPAQGDLHIYNRHDGLDSNLFNIGN
tara:strand:+ start:8353 stop:8493 length:141 start_codon:yes stop_codon:yes gene_type:complete